MTAVAFALMREYVNKSEHLLIDNLSSALRKKLRRKILTTVGLYFISIFAGYISTYISIGIFLLVIVMYFMPQNIVIETKKGHEPKV
jgi:Ca2+-dependent lipid-binding protein